MSASPHLTAIVQTMIQNWPEPIYAGPVAERIGCTNTAVSVVFSSLKKAGMMRQGPRNPKRSGGWYRTKDFTVPEHPAPTMRECTDNIASALAGWPATRRKA